MTLKVTFDVILVSIVLLGALFGFKRGFILTVTKPVKWFLAFLLAFLLASTVSEYIVQSMIEDPLTNQITKYIVEECDTITPANVEEELPTLLKLAAGAFDVDLASIADGGSEPFVYKLVSELTVPAAHLVSLILSFFITYILAKILLSISISLLNNVFEVGVLDTFNKILGFIFGAGFAFVSAWLLVVIFDYGISIPAIAKTEFAASFDGGLIYDFFKKMSPLDLLLSF